MEMQFNLTDAVLLGSENSYNATTEVLNNFMLSFDRFQLKVDALKACQQDAACSKIVNSPNSEILQYMMEYQYS